MAEAGKSDSSDGSGMVEAGKPDSSDGSAIKVWWYIILFQF